MSVQQNCGDKQNHNSWKNSIPIPLPPLPPAAKANRLHPDYQNYHYNISKHRRIRPDDLPTETYPAQVSKEGLKEAERRLRRIPYIRHLSRRNTEWAMGWLNMLIHYKPTIRDTSIRHPTTTVQSNSHIKEPLSHLSLHEASPSLRPFLHPVNPSGAPRLTNTPPSHTTPIHTTSTPLLSRQVISPLPPLPSLLHRTSPPKHRWGKNPGIGEQNIPYSRRGATVTFHTTTIRHHHHHPPPSPHPKSPTSHAFAAHNDGNVGAASVVVVAVLRSPSPPFQYVVRVR